MPSAKDLYEAGKSDVDAIIDAGGTGSWIHIDTTGNKLKVDQGVGKGPRIDQKRSLLDSAAVRSSAAAGGGTNVIVNAPSTSNSNSTVQKIDANPLMSNNPRRPSGVAYG